MLVEQYTSVPYPTASAWSKPANPLTSRLNLFVTLDAEEVAAIERLTRSRRVVRANETLVSEGDHANFVYVIMGGVAVRHRYLANGRRQIFGYLLPGDVCDTKFVILKECDHNVGLLCDTEVALISPSELMTAMVEYPKIERALLMMSLIDAAMLREWLLNVGQRDACAKLAHFFCEMSARFGAIGLEEGENGYSIPLTQTDLADTMGLTVVHVNRVLQRFRRDGLVNWSRRHFDIIDHPKLKQIAGFDANYLRLDPAREEPRLCAYG